MRLKPSHKTTLRQRLAEVMEPYGGRESSTASLVVDIFVLLCIVCSCTLVVLEHMGRVQPDSCLVPEIIVCAIFIVEYALRWYAAPNRLLFPFTFYAMVDLLAILPGLLFMGSDMILLRAVRGVRLLRLIRLIRLVRLLRFSYLAYSGFTGLRTILSAANHQYRLMQLARLFLWVLLAWFIGANVVHFTETELGHTTGPFADYWTSYWHILIVLVSGIEDKEPLSLLAKVEVTVLLIVGICMVGMLTGEIVSILVRKAQRAGKVAVKPPSARLEQHVLILGVNSYLDNIIRQVRAALGDQHYIVVVGPGADELKASDPCAYRRVFGLAGDPLDERMLEQADVNSASRVIVLSPDEGDADAAQRDNHALMEAIAVVCRRPNRPLVVELQTEESLRYAAPLEEADFLVSRHYGERLISQSVLNPGVTEVYYRLMTFTEESNEFYTVPLPPELEDKSFTEAQLFFLDHDAEDLVLVGIDRSPADRPSTRFWLNPGAELPAEERLLRRGDRLILIAYEQPTFVQVNPEDLWSGKILQRS